MNKIYPKNKYIIIILSISLCFFGKTDIFAFAGGDGSQNNPYQITTCQDLQDINQDLDAYYIINNNIDCIDSEEWNPNLSEWSGGIVGVSLIPDSYSIDTGSTAVVNNNGYYGFEPIGTELNPFTGNLDGNNHTISNLWIFRKTTQGVGLFGYINNSNIYNLNLINSDIVGARYTGGIAGYMDNGSLYDINLSQNMVRAYLSEYGGGLVGYIINNAEAYNVVNSGGNVHGSGIVIGGIVGQINSSLIYNSNTSANVDGGQEVGGFVGSVINSIIRNSYSSGNVRSDTVEEGNFLKNGSRSGGFAGYLEANSLIENSYSIGNVESMGSQSGGFVGYVNASTINNSYSTGNVLGIPGDINNLPSSFGGFIGESSSSTIYSVYATGNVSILGNFAGGLVGNSTGGDNISIASSTGNVTGNDYVGGFAGSVECYDNPCTYISNLSKVYSTGNVTGNDYVGGFAGSVDKITINNAYTAAQTVTGSRYVGGFVGKISDVDIDNAYSRADVISSEQDFVGGFLGLKSSNDGSIEGFWDNGVESVFPGCGNGNTLDCNGIIGNSTSAMRNILTFQNAGYVFVNMWAISSLNNSGYPYFGINILSNNESEVSTPTVVSWSLPRGNSKIKVPDSLLPKIEILPTSTSTDMSIKLVDIKKIKKYLSINMKNDNVKILQQFLIDQNKGPASLALRKNGVTKNFGILTKKALIEWQKSNNILPAVGIFGPKTISKIKSI